MLERCRGFPRQHVILKCSWGENSFYHTAWSAIRINLKCASWNINVFKLTYCLQQDVNDCMYYLQPIVDTPLSCAFQFLKNTRGAPHPLESLRVLGCRDQSTTWPHRFGNVFRKHCSKGLESETWSIVCSILFPFTLNIQTSKGRATNFESCGVCHFARKLCSSSIKLKKLLGLGRLGFSIRGGLFHDSTTIVRQRFRWVLGRLSRCQFGSWSNGYFFCVPASEWFTLHRVSHRSFKICTLWN